MVGDLVGSVPTLVTLNPIGTPVARAGMHVAAVLHSPDTETFLPPHRSCRRIDELGCVPAPETHPGWTESPRRGSGTVAPSKSIG